MTTIIPSDAYNVNLGGPSYDGSTDFLIQPFSFISGSGYYTNGTGKTAIYSSVAGITLTSQSGATIRGGNGAPTTSPSVTGGEGGIGVNLQASDIFINNGTVEGGTGGHYDDFNNIPVASLAPGGAGNTGVLLAAGAYLNNAGTVQGGIGGGVFLTGGEGGGTLFLETGPAGIGVDVAGGKVTNSGSIEGGGLNDNVSTGAVGVQLDAGSAANYLDNTGTITGGAGGAGGGAGVNFVAYNQYVPGTKGAIFNQGHITGGYSYSKSGGDGIDVAANQGFTMTALQTDLVNVGGISGGGGDGGGIGVNLIADDLAYNSGSIQGGNARSGSGASGGAGLVVNDGSFFFSNGGRIQGGTGDGAGSSGAGAYIGNGGYLGLSDTFIGAGVEGGLGIPAGPFGDAVQFASTGSGTLTLGANTRVDGQVAASYSAYDRLNLTQSGTLTGGLGMYYTGFSALSFNTGASWTVDATAVGITSLSSVNQFAAADTLDVTNLRYGAGESTTFTLDGGSANSGVLAITDSGNTYDIHFLNLASGTSFQLSPDGSGGTDITVACYRRGTRIVTERGERPIEELAIGDRVVGRLAGAASGINERLPIRWIGRRSYSGRSARGNPDILPVLIRAGALGVGLPKRNLWVSPGHAMVIDGKLVSAWNLVNGETIVQEESVEEVSYFHLEFDAHSLIFAEGALAESFVDDESRDMFDNAAEFHRLYPDAVRKPARYCASRIEEGWELQRLRRQLALSTSSGAMSRRPGPVWAAGAG
jgi:hypothetical protein